MIASRSQSWSASSRYCVVRKTVVPVPVDPAQLLPDRQPAGRVEAGGRLVEEQDLGLVDERRGEVEPALHAAGVALDHPVGGVLELDQLQQLARARSAAPSALEPEQPPVQDQQLAAGLARVEAGLLQRDADPAADLVRVAGDVDAGHLGAAGR